MAGDGGQVLAAQCQVDRVREAGLEGRVQDGAEQHALARASVRVEGAVEPDDALGERAGLVGAEHVHAAEVLDRVQAPDDDLLAGHALGAAGERDADDRGQEFRGEADGEGEREEEGLGGRPVEPDVHGEDGRDEGERDADQHRAEEPQPALEVGLGRASSEAGRDRPELGLGAGARDECAGGAAHDVRALEDGVGAGGEWCVGGDVAEFLLDRVALAGQRRLVDEEVVGVQQAGVGGDGVAGDQDEHVAGDELVGRDLDLGDVAQRGGARLDDGEQGRDGVARAVLLPESEQRAAEDDGEHDRGVGRLAEEEWERHREEEEQEERVAELVQEEAPGALAPAVTGGVGAVGGEPARGFGGGEAGGGGGEGGEEGGGGGGPEGEGGLGGGGGHGGRLGGGRGWGEGGRGQPAPRSSLTPEVTDAAFGSSTSSSSTSVTRSCRSRL